MRAGLGFVALLAGAISPALRAHDLGDPDNPHPHYDRSVGPPEMSGTSTVSGARPPQAAPFEVFAPLVRVRWDERFLYVESHGMPAHGMMVGITSWQQQVPVPQDYTGANAWRFPLQPLESSNPQSIKGHFLRGAIAIAANGVPIFNPQNNRGEISAEIGELDQWGGHCGRADDYHYHAAPLHLQETLGRDKPIAYALDGYAIYGLTEPDGSQPTGLDAFNGHKTSALGYHYHASTKYPYVNGGFHGDVTERDGQVDPQPRAFPVRQTMLPLRGATITAFTQTGLNSYRLDYTLGGVQRAVLYQRKTDGDWAFDFQNGESKAGMAEKVSGGGAAAGSVKTAALLLSSPIVGSDGTLPQKFTGDGEGISPPLQWTGAPAGTKSLAIIMHHIDPQGVTKWYWTLFNIPADRTSLPENSSGIGELGNNSVNSRIGYAPPHSKGPGPKTYVITLYALSDELHLSEPRSRINRDVLLNAMTGKTLATSEMRVTYSRVGLEAPPPRDGRREKPQ